MKKILILITILFATYSFSDTNTSNNNTNSVKTKSKKEQKPEECKTKKYCKNMSSCEEAKFYLEVCGYSNLDRDKDGIPCENVCK